MPAELPDDPVGEILLRLPAGDPACHLRASLACKRFRRIPADPAFRRRHRALHRQPPVLGVVRIVNGEVPYASRFVPTDAASSRRPAARDLPGWLALDCRHGRALFVAPSPGPGTDVALDFVVWDPLTGEQRRLPRPSPAPTDRARFFNAAVLCAAAAGGCDHRGCHGGPFRVVFLLTTWTHTAGNVTSARVYSSATGDWSEPATLHRPDVYVRSAPCPSALAGDALYFAGVGRYAFEYQLAARRLKVIAGPPRSMYSGTFNFPVSMEDGGLGLTDVEAEPCLFLRRWSRETAPDGVAQWARGRAIELETLLPDGALMAPPLASDPPPRGKPNANVIGFAEGTDVIFVVVLRHGHADVYMVHLSSGGALKVSEGHRCVFPYTSFCIPVMDVASRGEGPTEGVSSA
ncbi:hypothetical protein ACP70R_048366 [Stipagrostis hirtigluma subsp. patula]